ncbi:phosphoglycerol transferase MdoB-like AlkP superfamily enzyme [Metabacillus niabensis]|uniref:Phosphoglycerol transferase MdoB-like AlkP superfamily enzyme n=1 Tax=Metabacillus niabensis TaxID=324854 RepID=A0ABT9Z2A9_9BACI|nr:phosphoglycerol transferase MdoB-like AlkP superfamily enzyme [Metabacillus niabensis]
MNFSFIGLILQIIFFLFISVFNSARVYIIEHFSVYPIAFFELFLGVASLVCGLLGLIKKENIVLSIFVLVLGFLISFYFVFVYLLPEAGTPPVIRWFY